MRGDTTFVTAESLARMPRIAVERLIDRIDRLGDSPRPSGRHAEHFNQAVSMLINNRIALTGDCASEEDLYKVYREALRITLERCGPYEAPVRLLGPRPVSRPAAPPTRRRA